jgi:hypothetical protein
MPIGPLMAGDSLIIYLKTHEIDIIVGAERKEVEKVDCTQDSSRKKFSPQRRGDAEKNGKGKREGAEEATPPTLC